MASTVNTTMISVGRFIEISVIDMELELVDYFNFLPVGKVDLTIHNHLLVFG